MKDALENLKISFSPFSDEIYAIRAERDNGEKAFGKFGIPEALTEMEVAPLANNRGINIHYELDTLPPLDEEAEGRLLFQSVFCGDVLKLFHKMEGQRIRLILYFEVPGGEEDARKMRRLYDLPWELLYDHDFLTRDVRYSVVRAIDGDPPIINKPMYNLKTLLFAAMPEELDEMDLLEETAIIKKVTWPNIQLRTVQKAKHSDLLMHFKKHHHILHFMGHADVEGRNGSLALENSTGNLQELSSRDFARLMLGMEPKKRPLLVVLNACKGSVVAAGNDGLEGLAASLMRRGVPAVVAMRTAISDQAALIFSKHFYSALAAGKSLDEAMLGSRQAIAADEQVGDEWSAPVLYSKIPDGRLTRQKSPWPLVTVLVAALLLLVGLWQAQERLSFRDRDWWSEYVAEGEVSTYESVLEDHGLVISGIPFGRELRLVVGKDQIEGDLRWNILGLRFGSERFNTPWPKAPSTSEQRLEAMQKLSLNTLRSLGKGVEDLDAYYRALSFLKQESPKKAEIYLRRAIAHNDELAQAHTTLATLLFQQGRFEESLSFAERASALEPRHTDYRYNLGQVLAALGRKEAAMAAFELAGWEQGHKLALNEYGKFLLEKEDWAGAEQAFRQCMLWDPGFIPARVHLGRQYLAEGRVQESLELCDVLPEEVRMTSLTEVDLYLVKVGALQALGKDPMACHILMSLAEEGIQQEGMTELAEMSGCVQKGSDTLVETLLVYWQGAITLKNGKQKRPIYRKTALKAGDVLDIPKNGAITLVSARDHIMRVVGPKHWQQGMEALIQHTMPGFFERIQEKTEITFGSLARSVLINSRGGGLSVLAPRGRCGVQPRIALMDTTKGEPLRIAVEDDLGMGENHYLAEGWPEEGYIEWPWPEWQLEVGVNYTLVITYEGGEVVHPFAVTVAEESVLPGDVSGQLRMAYFESEEMRGEALIEGMILAEVSAFQELVFTEKLLEQGLLSGAWKRLEALEKAKLDAVEWAYLMALKGVYYAHRKNGVKARATLVEAHGLLLDTHQDEKAHGVAGLLRSLNLESE